MPTRWASRLRACCSAGKRCAPCLDSSSNAVVDLSEELVCGTQARVLRIRQQALVVQSPQSQERSTRAHPGVAAP